MEIAIIQAIVRKALASRLTPREEKILRLNFGIGELRHTLIEAAEKYDVNRRTVGKIKDRALRKLRRGTPQKRSRFLINKA